MREQAFACLELGGAVVTANDRAARALRGSYAVAQQTAGRTAWPTPQIFDWDAWLAMLWHQHVLSEENAPLLLSQLQERSIWKRVVDAQSGVAPSGDAEAIAKLASHAWELLSDFEQHGERQRSWRPYASVDAQAFQNWAANFERECRTNRWMSRSDLPALLTDGIRREHLRLPPEIGLIGFDRITPAQQTLLDAARAAGCIINEISATESAARVHLIEAIDLRDELTTCAWWARHRLEADRDTNVAVIALKVDDIRGEIERIFRDVLMPGSLGIESTAPALWEFSLGQPLSSIPVIKAAILLLRWIATPLEEAEISWLLLCGFFGAFGQKTMEMAKLDAQLRRKGRLSTRISIDDFLSDRPGIGSEVAQHVFGALRDIQRTIAANGIGQRRRTITDWLDVANSLLRQASWPGERTLDSVEYQALDRWDRFTGGVAALSFDERRHSYGEFVTVLDRYAQETIFSPESRDRPIQIMGAFEASGQTFDGVWFLSADDSQWPPPAQPNPLLPQSLQRRTGMPHAIVEVDWEVALSATRRIATSAPDCVFSYCRRNDAGELRPSALPVEVCGNFLRSLSAENLRRSLGVADPEPGPCVTIEVDDASSIPWPRHVHAGGVEILKMQSACPFQAFARRRLGAEELYSARRGLSPADRGTILHRVLEGLWSHNTAPGVPLRSRDDLVNVKTDGRLSTILSYHIEQVFNQYARGAPSDWSKAYLQSEQERLHLLLSQWLNYEIDRPPFTVVEHEKRLPATINGLELNLRVDRIDRVADGHLIVDYKTGQVSTSMWDGDRPEEPQLPLYAVHGEISDLKGVMFAQVRAELLRFSGHVENEATFVTNAKAHQTALVETRLDEELLGEWSDALSNLADGFLAGEAWVSPKSYPKTCKYCALPSLCRVAETAVAREPRDEPRDNDDTLEEGFLDLGSAFDD